MVIDEKSMVFITGSASKTVIVSTAVNVIPSEEYDQYCKPAPLPDLLVVNLMLISLYAFVGILKINSLPIGLFTLRCVPETSAFRAF